MCVFGHPIRDFIPMLPDRYKPHKSWSKALDAREEALQRRHARAHERLSLHTKLLPPLTVGDHVRIQNQEGRFPRKWDKTGVIVEVRQYDQYKVKIDGSNRITLRNRKFLRKFIPAQVTRPPRVLGEDVPTHQSPTQCPEGDGRLHPPTSGPILDPSSDRVQNPGIDPSSDPILAPEPQTLQESPPGIVLSSPPDTPESNFPTVSSNNSPRRSGRTSKPPQYLADYVWSVAQHPNT